MKQTTVATIRRILALYFCFGFGVVVPGGVSAQQVDSPLAGKNEQGPKGTMVQQRELTTALLAQNSGLAHVSVSPGIVGVWTYADTGTVNTYWIATPGGGIVVIDVRRDPVHGAEAIAAVRAVNVAPAKLRNALQSSVNSLYFSAMIRLTSTRIACSFSAGSTAVRRSEFCACCMPVGNGPAET